MEGLILSSSWKQVGRRKEKTKKKGKRIRARSAAKGGGGGSPGSLEVQHGLAIQGEREKLNCRVLDRKGLAVGAL